MSEPNDDSFTEDKIFGAPKTWVEELPERMDVADVLRLHKFINDTQKKDRFVKTATSRANAMYNLVQHTEILVEHFQPYFPEHKEWVAFNDFWVMPSFRQHQKNIQEHFRQES